MKNKEKKSDNINWYKIDNAGKMFQVVHRPYCDCVYRIAVNLKEEVNPNFLERAVNDLRGRFPSFFVRSKAGIFWYYFETNTKQVEVHPETPFINQYINPRTNNGYMFAIYYYNNRISLECLHAISDGYGSLEFLKAITYRYFEVSGYEMETENLIFTKDQTPTMEEVEDSYSKYYKKEKVKREKQPPAYIPKGKKINKHNGYSVIYGKMDSGELLAVAKKYKASITQYISALYTYSLIKTHKDKLKGKPITTCVPANVRGVFPSKTLRNFSLAFYCTTPTKEKLTFDEILDLTKKSFEDGMTKEKMQNFLNANVRLEKLFVMRIAPLPIKNIAIRIGKKLVADRTNTRSISNLGIVKMPKCMSEKIIDFECSNTDGISLMTANNIATLSFVRKIVGTEVEQYFFSQLAKEGVKIEIQTNRN